MKLKEKKLKADKKTLPDEHILSHTQYGDHENNPNIIFHGNPVSLNSLSWLAVFDKCTPKRFTQLR